MIHSLKCWPEYFEPVWTGRKTFEIRKHDRPFCVGDTVILKEWNPSTEKYTQRLMTKFISYMTDFEQQEGFVVLAIQDIKPEPFEPDEK